VIRFRVIPSFHNHPLFVKAWEERIRETLKNPEEYFLLFSAHSIPTKLVKKGDPYEEQTKESVSLIAERLSPARWALSYQSKVGFGSWLGPPTDETIKKLAREGVRKLALIPISFVSEHTETLYELDILYKQLALGEGIEEFVRVPTLQTHPRFIQMLESLVRSGD